MPPRDDLPDAVEVDAPGGTVTLGVDDGWPGVYPTELVAESDEWGSVRLAFVLRRPPHTAYADLASGLPCRYYVRPVEGDAAELVWSGRLSAVPSSSTVDDFSMRVEAEGDQAELDDDSLVAAWVLADQSRWTDLRSAPVVDINTRDPVSTWLKHGPLTGGEVAAYARGATMMTVPSGTVVRAAEKVGVWLDARKWLSFQQVFVEWFAIYTNPATLGDASGFFDLVIAGCPDPHFVGSTRREYWRAHVQDGPGDATGLGWHGSHLAAELVGVAPMPYLGIFLEYTPPPPPPPPDPRVVERLVATHATGPLTLTASDLAVGDYIVAVVVAEGANGPTNVVTPPDGTWVKHEGQAAANPYLAGRVELWRRAVGGTLLSGPNAGPSFTWTLNAGSNATVVMWVCRDVTGPASTSTSHALTFGTDTPGFSDANSHLVRLSGSSHGCVYVGGFVLTDYGGGSNPPAAPSVIEGVPANAGLPSGGGDISSSHAVQRTMGAYRLIADDDSSTSDNHGYTESTGGLGLDDYMHVEVGSATLGGVHFALPLLPRAPDPPPDPTRTTPCDVRVLLTQIKLAPDAELLTAEGASTIQPDRIIRDALLATRLAQDTALIETSSPDDSLEEYAADEPTTPRELCEAANAVPLWRLKVELDRRVSYRPRDTDPLVELPSSAGFGYEDAAGDSLSDQFNGSWISGRDALGRPVLSKRGTHDALTPTLVPIAEADVGGDHWALDALPDVAGALLGAAAITTTIVDSGTGALELQTTDPDDGEGVAVYYQRLGTAFAVGTEYRCRLRLRVDADCWTSGVQRYVRVAFYGGNFRLLTRETAVRPTVAGTWQTFDLAFVANHPEMAVYLVAGTRDHDAPQAVVWLDHLQLSRVVTTPLDERGARRTKVTSVSNALTPKLADRLNDALIRDAARPQFRGSAVVQGWQARLVADASPVHASSFLDRTGELVSLPDEPNPATGDLGRTPRIVGCSYDAASQTATVDYDNAPHSLDRLMTRLDRRQR
jgi:hypothetical protein